MINQKLFKGLVFTIVTFGLIISCKEEILTVIENGNSDIKDAQIWFENNYTDFRTLKSGAFSKIGILAKPDWKHAYLRNKNHFKTVEVPLSTKGQFGFATEESAAAYKETGDNRFMQTTTSLVIIPNNNESKTIAFLMTMVPDKSYRKENGFKFVYGTYKQWDKDFVEIFLP